MFYPAFQFPELPEYGIIQQLGIMLGLLDVGVPHYLRHRLDRKSPVQQICCGGKLMFDTAKLKQWVEEGGNR